MQEYLASHQTKNKTKQKNIKRENKWEKKKKSI